MIANREPQAISVSRGDSHKYYSWAWPTIRSSCGPMVSLFREVRGTLRSIPGKTLDFRIAVAPPAGAWIETSSTSPPPHEKTVAPPAGAWIETTACRRVVAD